MPATFAMTIRLPVPLKERLEQAAERRGDSQNTIIVEALERELDRLLGP